MMYKRIILGLALAVSAVSCSKCSSSAPVTRVYDNGVTSTQADCGATIKTSKGKYTYDLTPINEEGEMTYYNRVYGNFFITLCDSSPSCISHSTCCKSGLGFSYTFGKASTMEIHPLNMSGMSHNKGVTVTLKDGYMCSDTRSATSVIYLLCEDVDTYLEGASMEEDNCVMTATIHSRYACPVSSKSGLGAGSIILIILVVLIVVYFVGFGIFNYFVKGGRSIPEIIPNYEFWTSLPGLVVDGVKFIARGFKKDEYSTV